MKEKLKESECGVEFHYLQEVSVTLILKKPLSLFHSLLLSCILPLRFKDIFGGTYILIALHWFVCKPPESHCIKVIAMLWLDHHGNIFYLAVINFDIKKLKNNPAHFPLSKLGALEPNASY